MGHHVGKRQRVIALLMVFPLLALIFMVSRESAQNAKAGNALQSIIQMKAVGEVTDVINVALDVAKSSGLTSDPTDMYIAHGVYSELRDPSILESVYDNRMVYVVRLDTSFSFDGYGVTALPVNHLYIYIDADTGFPLGRSASKSPIKELDQKSWIKVGKSDIGKFPIPKFTPNEDTGIVPLKPTPTLAK